MEVRIAKIELQMRGYVPCKLNGTYDVELKCQRAQSKWLSFNATAIAADGTTTVVSLGASNITAVPSPLWSEEGSDFVFNIGASARLTFQYVEGDFASTILAAQEKEEEEEEEVVVKPTTKKGTTKK